MKDSVNPVNGTGTVVASKIDVANKVLKSFAPDSEITFVPGVGYKVSFNGKSKRWVCRGGSFFPMFRWNHGGTATTATSQLIRWLQNRPCLPLSTWAYWSTERISLFPAEMVQLLKDSGYPEKAKCCLCGIELKSFDWWHLDKTEGCCCLHDRGCRQGRGAE